MAHKLEFRAEMLETHASNRQKIKALRCEIKTLKDNNDVFKELIDATAVDESEFVGIENSAITGLGEMYDTIVAMQNWLKSKSRQVPGHIKNIECLVEPLDRYQTASQLFNGPEPEVSTNHQVQPSAPHSSPIASPTTHEILNLDELIPTTTSITNPTPSTHTDIETEPQTQQTKTLKRKSYSSRPVVADDMLTPVHPLLIDKNGSIHSTPLQICTQWNIYKVSIYSIR